MTDLQRNNLYKLVGCPRGYNGKNITIKKVVPGDGFVTIHAEGGNFNLEDNEIDEFIKACGEPLSPVDVVDAKTNVPAAQEKPQATGIRSVVPGYVPDPSTVKLKELLFATIEGVANKTVDPSVAKAVFDGSNALVNLQKSEIQLIQMADRRNSR